VKIFLHVHPHRRSCSYNILDRQTDGQGDYYIPLKQFAGGIKRINEDKIILKHSPYILFSPTYI
jgi:hypothetical protein